MQLLEKKIKCPLCGARNSASAARCRICTRPLANDPLPSQAVYDESLWSTKIASKKARETASPWAVLALVIALGVIANYFFLGYGPDWAHEPKAVPRAYLWQVYEGEPGYRADLPGLPMTGTASAAGVTMRTANVWVDGRWNLVKDVETRSVAALADARTKLHGSLVTAIGNAPADVASSIPTLVAALAPKSVLTDGGVTAVDRPAYGEQWDLVTTYSGWPEESDTGTVRARVTVFEGKVYIAATFVDGGDDPGLQKRLESTFVPDGVPTS